MYLRIYSAKRARPLSSLAPKVLRRARAQTHDATPTPGLMSQRHPDCIRGGHGCSFKASANPVARGVAEVVERATTKDTRGQKKTNCNNIVVGMRSDRNGIPSACLGDPPASCERTPRRSARVASFKTVCQRSGEPLATGPGIGNQGWPARVRQELSQNMRTRVRDAWGGRTLSWAAVASVSMRMLGLSGQE